MAQSWCVFFGSNPQTLVGFYSVHNPGRLNDLDSILERYAGKEELLVERLESKYSIDLSYARRAAAAKAAAAEVAATSQSARAGAPRVASVGDLANLPLKPSPPQHHHRHQQQRQPHQTRLPSSTGTSAAAAATQGVVLGAPTKYSNTATGAGANASSSYMTYLADQIRSNVEGFLPASNNGSGSGFGGGGGSVYPGPYAPPSAPIAGGEKHPATGFEGAAATAPGVGARGLAGGGGAGPTMSAGNKSLSRSSSSTSSNNRHQYVGGGSDPLLAARVRALEEERGGLLAACRRMQGKADAAAREVSVFLCRTFFVSYVSVASTRVPTGGLVLVVETPFRCFLFRLLLSGVRQVLGSFLTPQLLPWCSHYLRLHASSLMCFWVSDNKYSRVSKYFSSLMENTHRVPPHHPISDTVCCQKVAATEELHQAGQRKIASFAERAAVAERQTREIAARLRALESGQAALKVSGAGIFPRQRAWRCPSGEEYTVMRVRSHILNSGELFYLFSVCRGYDLRLAQQNPFSLYRGRRGVQNSSVRRAQAHECIDLGITAYERFMTSFRSPDVILSSCSDNYERCSQGKNESSARRCAAKHAQLLSAIDLQMSLR